MKLPKVETLIIMAFFGIVALWAVSKCSSKRSDVTRRIHDLTGEEEDRPLRRDTVVVKTPAPQPSPQQTQTTPVNTASPQMQSTTSTVPAPSAVQTTPGVKPQRPVLGNPATTPVAAAPATQTQSATQKYSTLYVTIDGLKMRKEPTLKGAVVTKLELYEPVFFLNQKTEKTEEISLGYEKVTDHWVKVRTKSGKEGWVFGAGVHYYKMKRKGVLE